MFGLTDSDLQAMISVFKSFPQIKEALIFGSRALNRHKKGSDVDIALKGDHLESIVTQILGVLNEESPLPYYFDILDYDAIINADLKDHIDRVGKQIFKK
jgi:predicted nucleotidyltransferase